MRFNNFVVLLSLALFSMSTSSFGEPPPTGSASGSAIDQEQVHAALQHLDRTLRQRLRIIAEHGPGSENAAEASENVKRLGRQLQALESRVHGWNSERGAVFLHKISGLRHLVESLDRAVGSPAGNVAGLTELHRALSVEWPPSAHLKATAPGDDCADAIPVGDGTYFGETTAATLDGSTTCGGGGSNDVWFSYTSATTKTVIADTFGSGYDTLLSIHTGCPGTTGNTIACDDDTFGLQSAVTFQAEAGVPYLIRVSGCCSSGGSTGPFVLNVGPGGTITGSVRDAVTGEPIPSVELRTEANGYYAGRAETGTSGEYSISGLTSGIYTVEITNAQGYFVEVYDDIPCPGSNCPSSSGTPLTVENGATTSNVDFALEMGGTISGTVRASSTDAPIVNVEVTIWSDDGQRARSVFTDSAGRYSAGGLYEGIHYATADSNGYRGELYNGVPCPAGGCHNLDPTTGSPIAVSYGETTADIDFALEQLGSITGQVIETLTGFPIPNVEIEALLGDGNRQGRAYTDSTGFYRIGGLTEGIYFVKTDAYREFYNELYDDVPCEPNCDPIAGRSIAVSLDTTAEGIDFVLDRLGLIRGTITGRPTGAPLSNTSLVAENADHREHAYSNASGNYLIDDLLPGSYAVTAEHQTYQDELYDDIVCQEGCDPADGHPVAAHLNSLTTDVDFALEQLGAVSGTVTHSPSGAPVKGAYVEIYTANGSFSRSGRTDSSGNYLVSGLVPGTHYAVVNGWFYATGLYDHLPCGATGCDPTTGTAIAVDLNTVTAGIDFAVERLGVITGTVRDAASDLPLEDVRINVYDAGGSWVTNAQQGETNGEYRVGGLSSGSYFLVASADVYRPEIYDNLPCESGCDPTTGVPIAATLNTVTPGIDFALDRRGGFTGTVTHAVTGDPLDKLRVEIYSSDGSILGGAFPDSAGVYLIDWLNPGTYHALAYHHELGDELYDGISCEDYSCDPTTGTPIVVELATIIGGIDFALAPVGPCVSDTTSLCLANGRFRVEVQWKDFDGLTGSGFAQPLTGDSGYFWFFGPNNIELVIKVLDACYEPFDHFWIFSGGLTNIATEVTVTDELTGEVQIYTNELGNAFQPITDTHAFATCAAGEASEQVASTRSWSVEPWTGSEIGTCAPSSTGLCLNQGRFLVEALWSTADGSSGFGQAVQLTDDAGYFWFFSPNNVEVLTKVLDACGLSSFENYWVFAAGLTDVQVTLRVTDTVSGQVRDYTNPQGTAFQPIQDTAAFLTCNP